MTTSKRRDDHGPPTSSDGEIRAEFDWSAVPPSMAVIETVAIAVDCEPTAIEPLFESVDPDALDTIVCSDGKCTPVGGVSVRFTHVGQDVAVHTSGTVVTRPVGSREE